MLKRYLIFALIAVAFIAADQASKVWIEKNLLPDDGIRIVDGYLNIISVRNPGGAFGIMGHSGAGAWRGLFFLVVSFLALALILYYVHKLPERQPALLFGLASIFGGAVGNLIDRLRLQGEVIDFIDVHWGQVVRWPTFNIADIAITVGAGIIAWHVLTTKEAPVAEPTEKKGEAI